MGYRKVNKRGERLIDKRHTFKGNLRRAGLLHDKKRKKKDECFISSVCFGEQAPETEKFRRWRDNFLVDYKLGRYFIKWYYEYGGELSLFIKKVKILKYIIKFLLKRIANRLN
tara:strand:+ start:119 stop:457 length:339 start_codon:yes stop_codon:yes gene_type:complete